MNKLILFNEPVQSIRKSQQTIHSRIAMILLQLGMGTETRYLIGLGAKL